MGSPIRRGNRRHSAPIERNHLPWGTSCTAHLHRQLPVEMTGTTWCTTVHHVVPVIPTLGVSCQRRVAALSGVGVPTMRERRIIHAHPRQSHDAPRAESRGP